MNAGYRTLPVLDHLDRDEVISLRGEWDDLLASTPSPSPFLTWPWVAAWLDTIGAESDLEVVTARDADDGRLIGIAPFVVSPMRRRTVRYRALRFLGSGPFAPHGLDIPVVGDGGREVAAGLWGAVSRRRRWDFIDLLGVAEGGSLTELLMRRRSDPDLAESTVRAHLDLSDGWDAVERRLPDALRRRIHAGVHRLDADTDDQVVERMVVSGPDLEETMGRLARMTEVTHYRDAEHAPVAHPSVHSFHCEASLRMLASGRLRMWRLDVADATLATVYAARFDATVVCFAANVDPRWEVYSPADRLIATAARGAADEGAERFVLPPGDLEYARAWGAAERRDFRVHRPAGPRGRLLWAGDRIRATLSGDGNGRR